MRIFSNVQAAAGRQGQTTGQTEGKVRYEQHTPAQLAALRSSGEAGERTYQTLRQDWMARGQPRGSNEFEDIFAAQRYEQLTPGQRAHLRSSGPNGEARYQELRSDWEARGRPMVSLGGAA